MTLFRHSALGLVATLAITSAWAGDAVPTTALLEATIADGAKLTEHWNASIYGKLWSDPIAEPLRAKFNAQMDDAKKEVGFDPRDVLAVMTGAALKIASVSKDKDGAPAPQVLAQASLGDFAAKLVEQLRKGGTTPPIAATIPGASEAFSDPTHPQNICARFDKTLLFAFNQDAAAIKPWAPKATKSDVQMWVDGKRYMATLKEMMPAEQQAMITEIETSYGNLIGPIDYQMNLIPEGVWEKFTLATVQPGSKAVDLDLVKRLPANTMISFSFGFDGQAYWKVGRTGLLGNMSKAMGTADADATEQQVNQQLQAMGVTATLSDLINGIQGSFLFAVTPGVPFPSVSLAIPRSPAFDQLMTALLTNIGATLPAEGTSELLPIPGIQIPVQLAVDKTHYLITSDQQLPTTWTTGQPGGFADSAAGKLALAKTPKGATLIGSSDTPTVLRTVSSYLGMALTQARDLQPADKQAILQLVGKAAALASTGYVTAYPDAGKQVLEDRGVFGYGTFLPIIAAIAIPNLLESRANANESAAAASLKSGIFPAEVQFQAGNYVDQNKDGIGEYGFLGEMAGKVGFGDDGKTKLSLLPPTYASGEQNGYHFAIFLPDGKGGSIGEPDAGKSRQLLAEAGKDQASHFVVYAWPTASGKRMFAITDSGQVFAAPYLGLPPVWNDLFGGEGWATAPTWIPYQQRGGPGKPKRRNGQGQQAPAPEF